MHYASHNCDFARHLAKRKIPKSHSGKMVRAWRRRSCHWKRGAKRPLHGNATSCRPWSIAALFGQNHSFLAYNFMDCIRPASFRWAIIARLSRANYISASRVNLIIWLEHLHSVFLETIIDSIFRNRPLSLPSIMPPYAMKVKWSRSEPGRSLSASPNLWPSRELRFPQD